MSTNFTNFTKENRPNDETYKKDNYNHLHKKDLFVQFV